MPAPKPAHQVCPVCGYDDDVTAGLVDGTWVISCTAPKHAPWVWTPSDQFAREGTERTGVGEDLGVYDHLLAAADQGFAEHGVLEYRYWERTPATYRKLVDMYGHKYLTEGLRYSASAFLARALSQLASEGLIYGTLVPATGRWSYNGRSGGYGPLATTETDHCLSWVEFATKTLGVSPEAWPPLSTNTATS